MRQHDGGVAALPRNPCSIQIAGEQAGRVGRWAQRHDGGTKTVLGISGELDASGFADAVLAQPASARFVTARLYAHLVSDVPPDRSTLDRLATAYGANRDLDALLRALLLDPSFAAAADSLVVGPVEWLVGAMRALRAVPADDAATRKHLAALRDLGQVPFYPPSVAGWPSGQA